MVERSGDAKERHWRDVRRWFGGLSDDLGLRRVMGIRRRSSLEVRDEDGGRELVSDRRRMKKQQLGAHHEGAQRTTIGDRHRSSASRLGDIRVLPLGEALLAVPTELRAQHITIGSPRPLSIKVIK